MKRPVITAAALLGLSAVLLGAFGAHGLKGVLTPEQLGSFETGVRYQIYHALALLGLAAFLRWSQTRADTILPWRRSTPASG